MEIYLGSDGRRDVEYGCGRQFEFPKEMNLYFSFVGSNDQGKLQFWHFTFCYNDGIIDFRSCIILSLIKNNVRKFALGQMGDV